MDGDHLEIDSALRNLASVISKDFNVQNDFMRQAEMLLAKFRFEHNEANPPPVPARKFHPRNDNIVEFIREEWGEWCRRGLLTRMKLKKHDSRAWKALVVHLQYGGSWPADIPVLTASDYSERWLAKGIFTTDEVTRASGLLQNRRRRDQAEKSPMML